MFNNKHVVITGGAKGIGKATAGVFLREGAKVSVLDLDPSVSFPAEYKEKAIAYTVDVSDENQVKDSLEKAIGKFGDIDVLVNNAGILHYGTVTETSLDIWQKMLGVNVTSFFLCAKYAIPSMLKQGKGVVVNVASVQAFVTQENVAAYSTSKSAVLGLTRSIALDYAPNIRCVAVCPGSIDTPMFQNGLQESPDPESVLAECVDMHPLKKIGSPEEVGELIAFLASDKASFITGQAYRVDGGLGIGIGGSKRV